LRAGLLLTDGKHAIRLMRNFDVERSVVLERPVPAGCMWLVSGPAEGEPAYLRLERQGNVLLFASSPDGRNWSPTDLGSSPLRFELPRTLKVGVIADATGEGSFKAQFSEFKLSQPGK
jgi:regulation of enolase protein 1 (concanavalin A-like superfamily)